MWLKSICILGSFLPQYCEEKINFVRVAYLSNINQIISKSKIKNIQYYIGYVRDYILNHSGFWRDYNIVNNIII